MQVGHLNFAEFWQPGVSHICFTITSAISNQHEHKQNSKEINQNKQQEIQSQFKNKYSVTVFSQLLYSLFSVISVAIANFASRATGYLTDKDELVLYYGNKCRWWENFSLFFIVVCLVNNFNMLVIYAKISVMFPLTFINLHLIF